MFRSDDVNTTTLSPSEDAIRQFESAWQAGNRPNLSDYLETTPDNRLKLLIELVHIDLEFHYRHNETPQVEHYLNAYPELKDNTKDVIELIRSEYSLRDRHGHAVSERDYLIRFPQYREQLEGQLAPLDSTLSWPKRFALLAPRDRPQIPGFDIEEELGHGGMGVVYRATQPALQRMVAIKTMLYGIAATDELKNRFRSEAEAIARLNHPHIVPVYEVGEWKPAGATASVPYFVMKYYAGGSLASETVGAGTDLGSHTKMVETIAQAVHHAHQRGILHRDLKPSNILLDEHGEPHVVDFGLAGRFDPDDPGSMTATIMGTPSYMAPEQARSPSQVTTSADVYGLGAVLYYLLTGQAPFQADTPLAVLERVAHQEPVRPSALNAGIPRDLETICLKCLEKEPSRRYDSATALSTDLARFRSGQSIMARPMQFWERAWRTIRRYPLITSLLMLTFIALAVSVVVLTLSNLRIREKEQETNDALQREKWSHAELLSTFHREQKLLYGKRIATVSRLWGNNQLPQAWAELDECPEQHRGWEWKYFNSLRGKAPITISTPGKTVTSSLFFLPDQQLISGDSQGFASIWHLPTKTSLKSWKASPKSIRSMAIYTPKNWLAVCDEDNIFVWNYATQEKLATLPGCIWVAFSPNGETLAASADDARQSKGALVWDTATWKQKWFLQGHTAIVLNGTISPDSQTLVTCSSDRTVRRWSLVDGKAVGEPWVRPLPSFRLAYLPDGSRLAEAQPSTMLWTDAHTGKELGRYNLSSVAQPRVLTARVQVATGPDPALVVVSGPSHDIQMWDIRQNRSLATFRGHTLHIGALELSPDGRWIASASFDQTICVWEVEKSIEYQSLGLIQSFVSEVSLSPNGQLIAVIPNSFPKKTGNDQISVLKTQDGSEVGRFPGNDAAVITNDSFLLTAQANGSVSCWNLKTGEKVWHHDEQQQRCISIHLSDDGKRVIVVQMNGIIKTLDRTSGNSLEDFSVTQSFFGPSSVVQHRNRIAFVGKNGVELWDHTTRSKLAGFPMNGTRRIVFSRDGKLVATAEADRVIRLRNAETGSLLLTFPGHPRTINSLAFNSDGKRLVSSCADGLIRIWDTETGLELVALPGHFEENVLAAWDLENDRIIAVDTKLHIWQAPTVSADKQ